MILIWGSNFYGKTDVVPGLFHVATRFGHLWYIPLIPMGSYLLIDEDRGVDIPLSGKSLLLTYVRAFALVLLVLASLSMFVGLTDQWLTTTEKITSVAYFIGAAAFMYFTTWHSLARKASYSRALELARALGPEAEILVERYFEQISEKELNSRLASGHHDGSLGEYGGVFEED